MADSELLLRWSEHHSLFFPLASSLCHNSELTDVTLSAGSSLFPAHRLVLSACSPYFHQLFRRLGQGSDKSVIYLKDVTPRHVQLLLEYMYQGEIRVKEKELEDVLNTARGLQILGLTDKEEDHSQKGQIRKDDNTKVTTQPPPSPISYVDSENKHSAAKKSKLSTRPLSKIGELCEVNVTSLPSDSVEANSLSFSAPECPSIKQEIGDMGHDNMENVDHDHVDHVDHVDDWNIGTSQQIQGYDVDISEEAYPETSLTESSNQVYDESAYYIQGKNDPHFEMNVGKRRGRPRRMSYTCHICGKHLRDKYNLDRHISSHYGEKNFACSYCRPPKLFADQSNLRNHIKSKHPEVLVGEKDFSCYQCVPAKLFTDQQSLTKHVRSRHNQQLCLDATGNI